MRETARDADLILLRDEPSHRHLEEIGASTTAVRITGDAAFGLAAPTGGRSVASLSVAVSARNWPYARGEADRANATYRDAVAEAVTWLVRDRGANVTFVSTCQGVPEYWTDDSAVAEAIQEQLPADVVDHVTVDRAFHRPAELMELLASFDLALATRMHMAILALVAGTPVFPIAYEFKMRELAERVGLGAWVQDLEDVRPGEELSADIGQFLDALPTLWPDVAAAVETERESALATEDLMRQALRSRFEPTRS